MKNYNITLTAAEIAEAIVWAARKKVGNPDAGIGMVYFSGHDFGAALAGRYGQERNTPLCVVGAKVEVCELQPGRLAAKYVLGEQACEIIPLNFDIDIPLLTAVGGRMSAIAKTNAYLLNPVVRERTVLKSVASSSAIEGIRAPFRKTASKNKSAAARAKRRGK